ncbi:MAG: ImmA/IrrE family metallo-endopeptidase [Anaerolineales bacterium]|nr:ImmA/IrrE family metallo-endopeptidase [Anaerolineales bacterium]
MKWIDDNTRRFTKRPFFEKGEIDAICEEKVITFFLEIKELENASFPIPTSDLEFLVEQDASSLDTYADLSSEGINVEGMTEFLYDEKPKVYISEKLANPRMENRRRSTLTHELGHVVLHDKLWPRGQMSLLDGQEDKKIRCNRENILNASSYDWLEWQASYASGAFLMPISFVKEVAERIYKLGYPPGPFYISSSAGKGLINRVQKTFCVSIEAAKVRLLQLNLITKEYNNPVLL